MSSRLTQTTGWRSVCEKPGSPPIHPGHLVDRLIPGQRGRSIAVSGRLMPGLAHEGGEFRARHGIFSQRECVADGHDVTRKHRTTVPRGCLLAIVFRVGGAHGEASGRNHDKLRARLRAIPKHSARLGRGRSSLRLRRSVIAWCLNPGCERKADPSRAPARLGGGSGDTHAHHHRGVFLKPSGALRLPRVTASGSLASTRPAVAAAVKRK